jgi:hypothetical protein
MTTHADSHRGRHARVKLDPPLRHVALPRSLRRSGGDRGALLPRQQMQRAVSQEEASTIRVSRPSLPGELPHS